MSLTLAWRLVATNLTLAWRLAWRDLRGGIGRLRLFLACLALGVAAVAAVGSVATAIRAGLDAQGGTVLGGDVAVRLTGRDASAAERRWLDAQGTVSATVTLRTMARPAQNADASALVELKAVDGRYPLYGAIALRPEGTLAAALARRDGVWGAVAERGLLDRLGLKVGDAIRLGEQVYRIRAELTVEPDRLSAGFDFGPRVMVARDSLAATGLLQAGSLVHHAYRIRLPAGVAPEAVTRAAAAAFPQAGWRVRDRAHASPRLGRTVDRMRTFLALAALTALAVGGIGVGNAVAAHLATRRATIGVLKAVGAPGRLVVLTFGIEVAVLAAAGIALGLAAGALAPPALAGAAWRAFAVPLDPGPHWGALALAAAAGIAVTAGFAAWPLSRAGNLPPSLLFRAAATPIRRRPGMAAATIVAGAAIAGIGVVVPVAGDIGLAAGFLGGLCALVAALAAAAWGLKRGGRALAGLPGAPAGTIRVALAGIGRPGAPTASVVVSLGVGLALLAALGQVGGSLSRTIDRAMPAGAPAYFFIDIQPGQADAFDRVAQSVPGVGRITQVPHLRGRIVRIAGRPADPARVPEGARWALRGDRGLTYAANPPANADIVAGEWWPADYAGPPLISFDAALARDFGLKVGDTLTYNVLGREITGRIASLRHIDWTDLQLNFTAIFSPGTLSAAPHTNVATVQCAETAEEPLMRAVNRAFSNVTAIRVRDVLHRVEDLMGQMALALTAASGISLAAGLLVLAGAVAAGRRARLYDAAVLHALGATRRQVLAGLAAEYLLLGIVAGAIAAVAGWLSAWAVVDRLMGFEAAFLPGRMAAIVGLGGVATLSFGLAGTWRALGAGPARLLRTA